MSDLTAEVVETVRPQRPELWVVVWPVENCPDGTVWTGITYNSLSRAESFAVCRPTMQIFRLPAENQPPAPQRVTREQAMEVGNLRRHHER
jgi:hypothetical protein